ncbi:unnamed protein product, partial [Rotaria sp. Silwood2]
MSARKRQKTIENKIVSTIPMTKFEQLPNELILMCFHYFDFYHLYEIFYYLNQRFNELIEYQTKIHIDLSPIPSKKMLRFCFQLNQLITASKNYPLSIVASDEHKFNLIFDDLFKDQFSKLKSLTLSDINAATIDDIVFDETTKLYERLERLRLLGTISRGDGGIVDTERLCVGLISSEMKSLKYLNLDFNPHEPDCEYCGRFKSFYYLYFDESKFWREKSLSHLETIIIG